MTSPVLTAEQRAAYKTRADRVQEIVSTIERLEGWRETRIDNKHAFTSYSEVELANRAWHIGIDTLIAQLESELADLDRPKGIEMTIAGNGIGSISPGAQKILDEIAADRGQVTARQPGTRVCMPDFCDHLSDGAT